MGVVVLSDPKGSNFADQISLAIGAGGALTFDRRGRCQVIDERGARYRWSPCRGT